MSNRRVANKNLESYIIRSVCADDAVMHAGHLQPCDPHETSKFIFDMHLDDIPVPVPSVFPYGNGAVVHTVHCKVDEGLLKRTCTFAKRQDTIYRGMSLTHWMLMLRGKALVLAEVGTEIVALSTFSLWRTVNELPILHLVTHQSNNKAATELLGLSEPSQRTRGGIRTLISALGPRTGDVNLNIMCTVLRTMGGGILYAQCVTGDRGGYVWKHSAMQPSPVAAYIAMQQYAAGFKLEVGLRPQCVEVYPGDVLPAPSPCAGSCSTDVDLA